MVRCNLCKRKLGRITHTHLWYEHKMNYRKFKKHFPDANAELIPWNKGKTKENNQNLANLSAILKAKKNWNFSEWQKKAKERQGSKYKPLKKDNRLA